MLHDVTRSILFCHIDPLESNTHLARIPGGVRNLGPPWAIAAVGTGRYGVTSNESRFPAEVVQRKTTDEFGHDLGQLPFEDRVPSKVGQKRGFIFGNDMIS